MSMNSAFDDVIVLSSNFLVRNFEQVVERNFPDHSLDLALLAREMEMSERQLQRKLKALTGQSPADFVRQYRLSKSRDYLLAGYSVRDTAKAVGFGSQAYFAHCFKAAYGTTPTQYRQETTLST